MRKYIFLLSLVASAAIAQTPPPRTVSLNLTPPVAWEDGTALNCGAAGACTYSVYRGACNGGLKTRVVNGAATLPIPVPNSVPGQCFTATATANGSESAQSAEARYRGQPNAPAVTVLVTIAVETQP